MAWNSKTASCRMKRTNISHVVKIVIHICIWDTSDIVMQGICFKIVMGICVMFQLPYLSLSSKRNLKVKEPVIYFLIHIQPVLLFIMIVLILSSIYW